MDSSKLKRPTASSDNFPARKKEAHHIANIYPVKTKRATSAPAKLTVASGIEGNGEGISNCKINSILLKFGREPDRCMPEPQLRSREGINDIDLQRMISQAEELLESLRVIQNKRNNANCLALKYLMSTPLHSDGFAKFCRSVKELSVASTIATTKTPNFSCIPAVESYDLYGGSTPSPKQPQLTEPPTNSKYHDAMGDPNSNVEYTDLKAVVEAFGTALCPGLLDFYNTPTAKLEELQRNDESSAWVYFGQELDLIYNRVLLFAEILEGKLHLNDPRPRMPRLTMDNLFEVALIVLSLNFSIDGNVLHLNNKLYPYTHVPIQGDDSGQVINFMHKLFSCFQAIQKVFNSDKITANEKSYLCGIIVFENAASESGTVANLRTGLMDSLVARRADPAVADRLMEIMPRLREVSGMHRVLLLQFKEEYPEAAKDQLPALYKRHFTDA